MSSDYEIYLEIMTSEVNADLGNTFSDGEVSPRSKRLPTLKSMYVHADILRIFSHQLAQLVEVF